MSKISRIRFWFAVRGFGAARRGLKTWSRIYKIFKISRIRFWFAVRGSVLPCAVSNREQTPPKLEQDLQDVQDFQD